jgi:hypothetical protein
MAKIRTQLNLELCTDDLPEATRLAMARCLQTEAMDEYTLWANIDAVIDSIADGQFEGVTLPEDFKYTKDAVGDIPKAWWKAMAFPKPMEKIMKAFWRKNPHSSINWT